MHQSDVRQVPFCDEYLELTDDIVYHTDANGDVLYLNRAGHERLGLEPGSARGRPWAAFVHEDDRTGYTDAVAGGGARGSVPLDFGARLVDLTGRAVPYRHRVKRLRRSDGALDGALGIARDMTEQRRLEEQFQQSQKLETIGMLAGGIAHDFNNMLAAILGYTELMLEEKSPDDPDYRALSYVQSSTERAAALAKQLLIFSRKSSPELKPVRLGAVAEETVQMLQRTLPKTIRIVAHLDETDDTVLADRTRLQQAVMNLCLNARDAMPRGGELRLEVERVSLESSADGREVNPGEYVRLRVQDTGQGMPPSVLERIWEPFFTTKPSGEGTGLGLSVVQGIVRAHQGHIQAESQPGRGTTFYLYVPYAAGANGGQAVPLEEPPGGEETILVVDDEPVLLDLLHEILSSKGYHVLAAPSGSEAIEYVEALGDRIQLVISDNMMPGMTGRQLAQEVFRRHPDMRILVCSGFSPTRESEIGEIDYVASYVQKPYQRRELLTRVREALDGVPQRAAAC